MKYPFLFSLASLESPSSPPVGETVVKILHVNPVSEVLEIWQSAAAEYERAHPRVKIQFDYLEAVPEITVSRAALVARYCIARKKATAKLNFNLLGPFWMQRRQKQRHAERHSWHLAQILTLF